jgi:DNA-binding IclR family transcriptional regulator
MSHYSPSGYRWKHPPAQDAVLTYLRSKPVGSTITHMARARGVTRQAVYQGLSRLRQRGLVEQRGTPPYTRWVATKER